MKIIGLTGGIAGGKSTAARILKDLGAKIIDADQVARVVVEPHTPAWAEIADYFGCEVLNPDLTLNRAELAARVFADPEKLNKLNKITHPHIRQEMNRQISLVRQHDPEAILVLEIPLLFETRMEKMCDSVWVVWVDYQTQIDRLVKRDNISREDAILRIESQMPLDEKARRADVCIDNTGSVEKMAEQVKENFYRILNQS